MMRRMKIKFAVFASILLSSWMISGLTFPTFGCERSGFEGVIETSQQTIYIQADGSVNPATAPIKRDGNRFTLTGDVDAQIVVDKDNIVIDGAGFTLSGTYNGTQTDLWIIGEGTNDTPGNGTQVPWTVGIDMRTNTRGVTIQNLNIKNFSIGI